MRRILAIARRPAVWLTLVAFPLWLWLLWATVPPPPKYIIATGVAESHGNTHWDSSTYAEVRDVSDDGSRVTIQVVHAARRVTYDDTRAQVLDTRTGEDVTPRRWADPEQKPVAQPAWRVVWLSELWEHPEGRAFLTDDAAWETLRSRFAERRAEDQENAGVAHWRVDPFPEQLEFSPDGLVLAYTSRGGKITNRGNAEGVTVEETRTGRRVAFLPGVKDDIDLAPGGRVAVSRQFPKEREGEQPRRVLWDLKTSTARAELYLPEDSASVIFTPDGGYVFAHYFPWKHSGEYPLRWWNSDTGRQVGQVDNAWDYALTAGGRVLVTKPLPERNGVSESYRLYFWDVATGTALGEWYLGGPADGSGRYKFAGSDGDRQLVAEFDPEYGCGRKLIGRLGDKIHGWTGGGSPPDREQVVVWDTAERREVLRVPGKQPALSANGQWLATIDSQGVIRVWEVPARRAWGVLLWYSAIAAVCTSAAVLLALRLVRWGWRVAWGWWPGRVVRWAWRGRVRRRWVIVLGGCAVVAIGGWVVYAVLAAQAQAHLEAVFEEVRSNHNLTEADVAALVGQPPDSEPLTDSGVQKKGGGRGGATTLRRWSRFGAELDVYFGHDGTAWAVCVTNPTPLEEKFFGWLESLLP